MHRGAFVIFNMSAEGAASGWVLPEKWSEDLVDENGQKMSKRYEILFMNVTVLDNMGRSHCYLASLTLSAVSSKSV